MGGLFIDDFVIWLVKLVRKEIRIRRASKWPLIEGTILRSRIVEDGFTKYRPVADYSITLIGEAYYGEARGYCESNEVAADLADMVLPNSVLHIRYDPNNPKKNLALNRDNPNFRVFLDE